MYIHITQILLSLVSKDFPQFCSCYLNFFVCIIYLNDLLSQASHNSDFEPKWLEDSQVFRGLQKAKGLLDIWGYGVPQAGCSHREGMTVKSNKMALSDGKDPEYTLPSLHPRTMLACCPKGTIKPPLPEDSKAAEKQLWISVIPPK